MNHRVRVRIGDSEFEVEGPAEFVQQHMHRVEAMLDSERTPSDADHDLGSNDRSFGELLQALPSSSGTDRMLLAGKFAQETRPDRLFAIGEINALLKEQGVRLGNPSQTAANLIKAKLIFREKGKLRVSSQGEERLRALMTPS